MGSDLLASMLTGLAGVLFATAAVVLGFWLAWLAVLLIERNPSMSPVAVLLA